jgi:hypothetical protein
MILIDYSAIVIASILGTTKSDVSNFYEDDCDLLKHIFFNKLRYYKKTFGHQYGDIVIALDGNDNWRVKAFPNYKVKRKKTREDSKVDWKKLYAISDVMKQDLRDLFPYKVIELPCCEADDIIGVLAKYINEPTVIISNDKDFKQLLDYPNVSMYSPLAEALVKNEKPAHEVLIEHVLRGDSDDSIPNILSDDEVFVDKRRQKSIYATYVAEFWGRMLRGELTDEERRNWNRNVKLIDLNAIPKPIKQEILDQFTNYVIKGNRTLMMDYFILHKFKMLLPVIDEF